MHWLDYFGKTPRRHTSSQDEISFFSRSKEIRLDKLVVEQDKPSRLDTLLNGTYFKYRALNCLYKYALCLLFLPSIDLSLATL